jgi:hypothetical protein
VDSSMRTLATTLLGGLLAMGVVGKKGAVKKMVQEVSRRKSEPRKGLAIDLATTGHGPRSWLA